MIDVVDEAPWHAAAREDLLDRVFGPSRFEKPSERLREGRLPEIALSAIEEGELVGTVRLWRAVTGDGRAVLLLGPLAVSPVLQGAGLGGRLMRAALNKAAVGGHEAVILVGDPAYYARFGFTAAHTGALSMPGAYDQHRLLAHELATGALDGASGTLRAAAPLATQHFAAVEGAKVGAILKPWPPVR
ncbi:putative N-acetyltransferase YhbS [Breoghania corrubedonensis]|uniref:Putative N-acetyltransferase YhbS n=1 Tax=Breoghania corrubedonensis TaxID=665038 RepID=A0A2T5V8R7_9HYPH|nr:N-acetyltransferase [Breoghania corrubedonensis]PTW60143.1 putative N-acetyltransferase YhbS [Breoghania corrubedonensis]